MGVKLATTCLHWSQPVLPRSLSSSQALASPISSHSSRRRQCRYVHTLDRSTLFGTPLSKLHRSLSFEYPKQKNPTMRRACSASLDAFSDEEFSKKIQELAHKFKLSSESEAVSDPCDGYALSSEDGFDSRSEESSQISNSVNFVQSQSQSQSQFQPSLPGSLEPPWPESPQEQPDWPTRDDMISENIEQKANSVDLPLSLRIIRRKIQWEEGFREAGESAYCSVKKAFSSMVFMIQELQSYTLQLRELLFYEDLQGILVRVQKELHASFVWLFQQVFSHTPTLMMSVMILLANFTVYSMAHNTAMAASPPPATTEIASIVQTHDQKTHIFDSSTIKTFSVSSSNGKTSSVDGKNGGGGKIRPVASGTNGDGGLNPSDPYRTVVPEGASQLSSLGSTRENEPGSKRSQEEEVSLWNSIVEEASEMEASMRDEALDHETMQRFVSLVTVKIEPEDYTDFLRTELLYQTGLSQEPNNCLLLANYAQFLYLVAHDYDRAEEYFRMATKVEAADAEAYNKYATFLWRARNDLWAAEETFLEAISADPSNSYYAANYAHFLWDTGGEDTCFPLTSSDPDASMEEA